MFCLAVVAEAAYQWPGQETITVLGALAFLTTAVSGLDYVLVYSRRAVLAARAQAAG